MVEGGEPASTTDRHGEVWAIAVHHFEWGHVVSGVDTIVEDKLSSGEVIDPVILSGVCEQAEMLLHLLVCAFCLSIRLRVVSRGEGVLNP